MTKAFAQERAQQPSSARDSQEHPSDAGSQIPVLIRLPELATSSITVQAGAQAEPDQPKTPPAPVEHAAENSDLAPSTARADTEPAVAELPSTAQRQEKDGPWWSDFRVPSSVIHAVVALALIAVFIVAYMAIVGGGNEAEEIAGDTPAVQERLLTGNGKGRAGAQKSPELDFNSFVPKDGQKPAVGGASPGKAPAAAKPPGGAAKKPAVQPKQPPAKKAPAPIGKQLAGGPKKPPAEKPASPKNASAIAAQQQASSIQQTEFESPAESLTGQPARQTPLNQGPTERPVGFRNENPARQGFAANNPPQGTQAGSVGSQASGSPPVYPTTNPASYQYPADYHERLRSPAADPVAPRSAPWPGGGAGNDGRPSTARLQPRIEAPPIR